MSYPEDKLQFYIWQILKEVKEELVFGNITKDGSIFYATTSKKSNSVNKEINCLSVLCKLGIFEKVVAVESNIFEITPNLNKFHALYSDFKNENVYIDFTGKGFEIKRIKVHKKTQILGKSQLLFNAEDGITVYRGVDYQFKKGKKAYALLDFMSKSKKTPFGVDAIIKNCNDNIKISRHKFKGEKDISDTINNIRSSLKVNKGEYFPIYFQEQRIIWQEK